MTDVEEPWFPAVGEIIDLDLINPHGTRHLRFDRRTGTWSRLWQHRPPEPLTAAEAMWQRPSDIDLIIVFSNLWIIHSPGRPRAAALIDELAQGAKAWCCTTPTRPGCSESPGAPARGGLFG